MRRQACKVYALDGVCRFGRGCKFAHPSEEIVRGLCRRFLRGECGPESHCRMAHDVPVLESGALQGCSSDVSVRVSGRPSGDPNELQIYSHVTLTTLTLT